MGAAAFILLAVRSRLVLLLTGGSLTSPVQGRVERGGLLLLAVRGYLVHLHGQWQPPSLREYVRGAAALPFLAVLGRLAHLTIVKL